MTQTNKVNLMFLVTVIVFMAGSWLVSLAAGVLPMAAILFLSELILLAGPFLYMAVTGWRVPYKNSRRGMASWSLLCLIGITLCVSPLVALLNMISSMFAGNAAESLLIRVSDMPLLLRILLIAVWPAIAEEFVFRGLFFRGLRRHGLVKAMVVSSLMFGLVHLNFNQFSYAFVIGLVMAFAVEAAGTLHASVVIHVCLNLPSVLIMDALQAPVSFALPSLPLLSAAAGGVDPAGFMNNPAYITFEIMITALLAAIGTPLMIVLMKKLIRLNEREDYMSWVLKGGEKEVLAERGRESLLDPFLIAGVILCVGYMVLSLF